MSLDVYLKQEGALVAKKDSGIYIRENGQTKQITMEEWNERNPGCVPVQLPEGEYESEIVFDYNITHNLGRMATNAGIYMHLWRPEEIECRVAKELIEPLTNGLERLRGLPDHFKKFNPANGWGNYEGLVTFVEKYLDACKEYPEAAIEVSR